MEFILIGILPMLLVVAVKLNAIAETAARIALALEEQAEHQRWIENNTRAK